VTPAQQAFLDKLVLRLVQVARKPVDRDTDRAKGYIAKIKAKSGLGRRF
jgi:hypothetical protein